MLANVSCNVGYWRLTSYSLQQSPSSQGCGHDLGLSCTNKQLVSRLCESSATCHHTNEPVACAKMRDFSWWVPSWAAPGATVSTSLQLLLNALREFSQAHSHASRRARVRCVVVGLNAVTIRGTVGIKGAAAYLLARRERHRCCWLPQGRLPGRGRWQC